MTDRPDAAARQIRLTEWVTSLTTESDQVVVTFNLSAAEYHVAASHPDLARLMGALAESWRSATDVDVMVEGTTIVDVTPAEGA